MGQVKAVSEQLEGYVLFQIKGILWLAKFSTDDKKKREKDQDFDISIFHPYY